MVFLFNIPFIEKESALFGIVGGDGWSNFMVLCLGDLQAYQRTVVVSSACQIRLLWVRSLELLSLLLCFVFFNFCFVLLI